MCCGWWLGSERPMLAGKDCMHVLCLVAACSLCCAPLDFLAFGGNYGTTLLWDRKLIGPSWFRHFDAAVRKCSTRAPTETFQEVSFARTERDQRTGKKQTKKRIEHILSNRCSVKGFYIPSSLYCTVSPRQCYYLRRTAGQYRSVSRTESTFGLLNRTPHRRSVYRTEPTLGLPTPTYIRSAVPIPHSVC